MWMDKFTISSLFINIYRNNRSLLPPPPHFEIAEITVSLCSSSTRNSISRNLIDDIFPVLLSPCVGKGMTHFRGEGKSSGIHTALNSTRGGGGGGGGRPFRNFRNSGGDSVDGNRYLRTVRGNGYRPSTYSCRRKESDGFTKLRHTERNSDAR